MAIKKLGRLYFTNSVEGLADAGMLILIKSFIKDVEKVFDKPFHTKSANQFLKLLFDDCLNQRSINNHYVLKQLQVYSAH